MKPIAKIRLSGSCCCALLALAGSASAAMIDIVGMASSCHRDKDWYADAVNGVGLSGGTHDTGYQSAWMSTSSATLIDGGFYMIDLKREHLLDSTSSLKIWNCKYSSGTPGFRNVKFYVSSDAQVWTERTVTIRNASGSVVTEIPKGTAGGFDATIDFGAGVCARYIKMQAVGGVNAGNWNHAGYLGLSEIQAFGTATGNDPVVSGKHAVSASSASGTSAGNTSYVFDGTGLTGTGDQHRGNYATYGWCHGISSAWIAADLGQPRTIQGIKIWNTCGNQSPEGIADSRDSGMGMRTVDIWVSNDNSAWTKVFDDLVIPAGHDSDNSLGVFYDSPFLLDTRAAISGQWRYIKFDTVGNSNPNWFDATATGLSEVQFFETFTPPASTDKKGTVVFIQ